MSLLSSTDVSAIRECISDAGVFGSVATIQNSVSTTSPSGGKIQAWATMTGHESIPCYISQIKTTKRRSDKSLYSYSATQIKLNSYYPDIQTNHRVLADLTIWKILDIITDSQKIFTVLEVERWA